MNDSAPVVFVCHASADKDRFVYHFAEDLRKQGIDAWLDEWEMQPGDSLTKIFDEGIKKCNYFIIVLSEQSITRKWVREELDVANVKRIEDDTRLIPIMIDEGIEIPESIKHLLRVSFADEARYQERLNEIVDTVFGRQSKPPIGKRPEYTEESLDDLSSTDTFIIKLIRDDYLEHHFFGYSIDVDAILKQAKEKRIDHEQFFESIEFLEYSGYISTSKLVSSPLPTKIDMDPGDFLSICERSLNGFEIMMKKIVSSIINDGISRPEKILSSTEALQSVVEAALMAFGRRGYIHLHGTLDNPLVIDNITVAGKRYFSGILDG